MKRDAKALLRMQRTLCKDVTLEQTEYTGNVLGYDETNECIFLCIDTQHIENLSLDSLYECEIFEEQLLTRCTGVIEERYYGEMGKTVKFRIKNGFYKINIKCVDKS